MIRALVLDLGGVVLDIDFRRTFRHWAAAAGVEASALLERWQLDDAYRRHEVGALGFDDYCASLGSRLGLELSRADWLAGWNALFAGSYREVQRHLPAVAARLPLYALTNTNPTHAAAWRSRFPAELAHFREIFVSSEMGLRKPDRAAYLHVADALALPPETILFVDDSAENVHGARAAGMAARHVRSEADVVAVLTGLLED